MDTTHFHPMIVHFPIALILVGFLADVIFLFWKKEICLSKTGFYLMILGTLAAGAAFATGHLFTNEPGAGDIVSVFEKHETFALITLLLMTAGSALRLWSVIWKKQNPLINWTIFAFYLLGVISVSYTGFMGGDMVYNYMMGF